MFSLEKRWQKGMLSVLLMIGLCYGGSLRAQLKKEEVDFEVLASVTVMPGENCCLWNMAAKHYGDPYKWTILKEVNKIPNESKISEGTVIYIPAWPIKKYVEEPEPERKRPKPGLGVVSFKLLEKLYLKIRASGVTGRVADEVKRAVSSDDARYNAAVEEAFHKTLVLAYEHRSAAFRWQLLSSKIIFVVVIVIVIAGLYFSGVHFHKGLQSKPAGGDQTQSAASGDQIQFAASVEGIKISSPILGVIILAMSLIFLYLYVAYVHPIHVINEEQVVNGEGETKAIISRFLMELPDIKDGRIARILDCDVGLVSQIRHELLDAGELQRDDADENNATKGM